MLETRPIDLQDLAEDLHLAMAVDELTKDQALAFILHLCGPEMTDQEAGRVLRRGDPAQMTCAWEKHPVTGDRVPQFGPPRRLWDRQHGADHGRPVLPELAEKWGDDITRFAAP
ncbi:hypothetical protein Sme01_03540 [Sphaerisporangium melleum]|uniref:Uncharacterized protein n=1 Tax=Sphaerisporangium melleum TaxID=321316 RepID=A0A917QP16_9ACTN|nr:hypothetical protein [Sphaerisporangium melleum]GGK61693.1 hypothetical protein GCM10007964_01090 [Sphaerisporangium melleum]GII67878.1 hypothetical protein Sme01_03540 [Sphaerisporangium melleum]